MGVPRRIQAVQRPIVPIIGRLIDETPGTISLGQGMVFYPPPPEALRCLEGFGRSPADHGYGPVEGSEELRARIAAKLAAENGVVVGPACHAVVTAGGNMAFMHAVLAVTDPGDEVILQAPYYFNHEMAVVMAGCRPVIVQTDPGYQVDPEAIAAAITSRTRAVVTISPNNPTGAVYPEAALRAVNGLCRERGLYHVHDEVYEYFTYGTARHFSPGSIEGASCHTISLFSLSKAYGFAGWRIGYMTIPADLAESMAKIQDTILICPPIVAQRAATAALDVGASYCFRHRAVLARVREDLLARLARLAGCCDVPSADGAFYCLLRVRTDLDSLTLATRLIREHLVATIPGSAFGVERGCSLRVSYGALGEACAVEGIERLVNGLAAIVS